MKLVIFAGLIAMLVLLSGCTQNTVDLNGTDQGSTQCEEISSISDKANCIEKEAIATNNPDLCDRIEHQGYNELCYINLAIEFKDESICEKINTTRKNTCLKDIAKEYKDLSFCEKIDRMLDKDQCYKEIAWKYVDHSICDKIESNSEADDYFRDDCYFRMVIVKNDDPTPCDKMEYLDPSLCYELVVS